MAINPTGPKVTTSSALTNLSARDHNLPSLPLLVRLLQPADLHERANTKKECSIWGQYLKLILAATSRELIFVSSTVCVLIA